jgi:hydroxymethylbilane synthase
MTSLRVGTRGSDLARTQTGWVCDRLRDAHPGLQLETVIIRTHGDAATDAPFDERWPVGSFVTAIEAALLAGEVDLAVHSYKDLPTAGPPGLVIAAVPPREVTHDVLVVREPVELDRLPAGFRIGTSSPRRIAQMRRLGPVEIVPIRGNVPTRLRAIEDGTADGVVLAAAGLRRLGIEPAHAIDLPTDRFVPPPAQGALAVQTREGDPAAPVVVALDHAATRAAVAAERRFLARAEAGCQTPLGALAVARDGAIELRAQLFTDDGSTLVEGTERGAAPDEVGNRLADRLLAELRAISA